MTRHSLFFVATFAFLAIVSSNQSAIAQEPSWYPYVIARGQDRMVIEDTPMELRPYRPFHFYGNTVRRIHYRGNPMPLPRDWMRGTAVWFQRGNYALPPQR